MTAGAPGRLAGTVALITGGTSGIGRAIADVFAREGAAVAVTGRDAERGQAVEAALSAIGPAMFLAHDVTDDGAWARVLEQVTRRWGRLDTVVNNAGYSVERTIAEQSVAEFDALIATNLTGAFLGMKLGARAILSTSGSGSIINISSAAAAKPHPALSAYTAAKAALEALTRCAALEHGSAGEPIRVNAIRPGHIRTEANEWFLERLGDGCIEAGVRELGRRHPIGRIGEPRDVAYQALYLASEEASFVTGSVFACDGGFAL